MIASLRLVGRALMVAAASGACIVVLLANAAPGPAQARRPAEVFALATVSATSDVSVTVEVLPEPVTVDVGDLLSVTVRLIDHGGTCSFLAYDLTLIQEGPNAPIFQHVSPPTSTVGPPVYSPTLFVLQAVHTGAVTFRASVFGEKYCGFWQWWYLSGESAPVRVGLNESFFLPLAMKN